VRRWVHRIQMVEHLRSMFSAQTQIESPNFAPVRSLILAELTRALEEVSSEELALAQEAILQAKRVFVAGAGRSGLALKMAAMRLMHLGLTVHVAGEVTAPAIEAGDLLLIASGSGTTSSVVHAAEVALNVGAEVLALTTARNSRLGGMASAIVVISAATKRDHGGSKSEQYAGALFEQSVVLVMDMLFQSMWQQRGKSAEELWARHANLE